MEHMVETRTVCYSLVFHIRVGPMQEREGESFIDLMSHLLASRPSSLRRSDGERFPG